jgi:dTDP-4-dehydrorhamnose reductase
MSTSQQLQSVSRKILVVGASGLVGNALMSEFAPHYNTTGTFCKSSGIPNLIHMDLRDRNEVRSVLLRLHPDVILCSAAEPNVELCEIDPASTRLINVVGLQTLIEVAAEIGAGFVYFSSEYVFDGVNGPYSENDLCNPLNEYGRQKAECERMIAAQLDRYMIGRVSGVYGWEKRRKNFVVRLIDSLGAGHSVKVPYDQIITPTYAPNLARSVRRLVENSNWGLLHLSGSPALLRTDFAYLIATVFDLNASLISPTATSELKLHAARPRSAGLAADKARTLLDFPVVGPREGLELMKKNRDGQLGSGYLKEKEMKS